nr:uncharacterized protein LOC124807902 isoform X5 [Hydra vulgaris]
MPNVYMLFNAAHYEAFLRYLQSTQPTTATSSSAISALVPSSIALSVPSTSAIIVTSSAATTAKFINYYFLICSHNLHNN